MAGGAKVNSPSKSPAAQANVGSPTTCTTPKVQVVGPNVRGKREEYQLVRRLQSALFGGVYEAKGLSSGRDFAIKVLHKSELSKAQETSSIEFCEVPLSEIHFAELMRGDEHVMEAEEHFEDLYCYYVVFDLCRGGDLLEALKQKPHGFDEAHAQFLIKQAAKGLAYLHRRRVAMQDVSLENMLLHVNETSGQYQVKVCDPGQAVIFETDQNGEELQVGFRGLVGKSFRPPELHDQKPYHATKVDSWCLGWSTFYLLTAQPLFMSADPQQQDADWLLFQQGEYAKLFQNKLLFSRTGLDFIFRLLQLEPSQRMSIADSLEHAWLADPKIMPVIAPKELLPEPLRQNADAELEAAAKAASQENDKASGSLVSAASGGLPVAGQEAAPQREGLNTSGGSGSSLPWLGSASSSSVPTWAAANVPVAQSPLLRERGRHAAHHPGVAARSPYVIATAHSPPPQMAQMPRHTFLAPRAASRPKLGSVVTSTSPLGARPKVDVGDAEKRMQDRSWTFRSDAGPVPVESQSKFDSAPYLGRHVQSPPRKQVYLPSRSLSPPQGSGSASIPVRLTMRTPSPVAGSPRASGGFMWTQAPAGLSPRGGLSACTAMPQPLSPVGTARATVGFAWSPDPPSPRALPRSFSPTASTGAFTFAKAFTVTRQPQPRRSGPPAH